MELEVANSKTNAYVLGLERRDNRLNKIVENVIYRELSPYNVRRFTRSYSYRIFFLLQGEMYLSGEYYGFYPLQEGEMILLPPWVDIDCGSLKKSTYAIIHCGELERSENKRYFETLKLLYRGYHSCYAVLPIKKQAEILLWKHLITSNREEWSFSVFESLVSEFQSIYTREEMVSLFYPMLGQCEIS
ncbi:hypothetical protein [Parabacteroides sp. PF5-9]|uniref:hypothetical protein n=1 Tax=Parabacteroides sp. PF5-9 TaxID=1742404 RepID=UPI0024751286|nr:hypothetical protein [Parabacteroides sp. PF5-9]MDH6357330.1 hypothetical protein [Parabacteroides sp. PF5-9]